MSVPRIASSIAIGALIRRVEGEGGFAVIAARGDSTSGAILIICLQRGEIAAVLERALANDGEYAWREAATDLINDQSLLNDYLARKRRHDSDLWQIEVDVPDVERFIAQLAASA